ncbi:hypothetical protein GW17_00055944 [Ensete ventricosum]|nr:hypothetical protein GW17_00055944 [Ensete ventricosum]
MLQERPQPSNPNEHLGEEIPTAHHALGLGGQLPLLPYGDGNTSAPTPSRYYRLFNDPGFSLLGPNVKHPIVSAEAFFGLTHQVQALVGMMHTIISLIPQLTEQPTLPRPPSLRPSLVSSFDQLVREFELNFLANS